MRNKKIENEIATKILERFPTVKVYSDFKPEREEVFILVNDEKIYHSAEYGKMMMDIQMNILLKNGIPNVYLACVGSSDELPETAQQLPDYYEYVLDVISSNNVYVSLADLSDDSLTIGRYLPIHYKYILDGTNFDLKGNTTAGVNRIWMIIKDPIQCPIAA